MLRRTFLQTAAAAAGGGAGTRPPWARDDYHGDDPVAADTDDPFHVRVYQTRALTEYARAIDGVETFKPAFAAARYIGTAWTPATDDLYVWPDRTPVEPPYRDAPAWMWWPDYDLDTSADVHLLLTRRPGPAAGQRIGNRAIVYAAGVLTHSDTTPAYAPLTSRVHYAGIAGVHEVGHVRGRDHRDGAYWRRSDGDDLVSPMLAAYVTRLGGETLSDGTTIPENLSVSELSVTSFLASTVE